MTVNGTPVTSPRPNEIAYVFQESTLFPWYTVLENFRLALKFRGIEEAGWRDRAMQSLSAVGMEQFANHYPKQLSVGMKQRINLARGLCVGTEVLLLDEPFAALDEQTRMVLGEDLSILLARTGKTIVFVTHSLAEAVFLADRIVVMTARPGKVKASIQVPEPHPRSPDFMLTDEFQDIRKELYGAAARRDPRHRRRHADRPRRAGVMGWASILSFCDRAARDAHCCALAPLAGRGQAWSRDKMAG